MRAWWDRWLKGIENGIEDEPMFRVWMRDSGPLTTSYTERPGRWISESSWPSSDVCDFTFQLDLGPLATTFLHPKQEEWRVIRNLRRDISTLEVVLDTGTTRYEKIDTECSYS